MKYSVAFAFLVLAALVAMAWASPADEDLNTAEQRHGFGGGYGGHRHHHGGFGGGYGGGYGREYGRGYGGGYGNPYGGYGYY